MKLPKPLWSRHSITKSIRDFFSQHEKYNSQTNNYDISNFITSIIDDSDHHKKILILKLLRLVHIKNNNDKYEPLLTTTKIDRFIALLQKNLEDSNLSNLAISSLKDEQTSAISNSEKQIEHLEKSKSIKSPEILTLTKELNSEVNEKIESLSENKIITSALAKVLIENDCLIVGRASFTDAASIATNGKALIQFESRNIVLQKNSKDSIDITIATDAYRVYDQNKFKDSSSTDFLPYEDIIPLNEKPLATTITELKLVSNSSQTEAQLKVDNHHEIMYDERLSDLIPDLKPSGWENFKTNFIATFFNPRKKYCPDIPRLIDATDKPILKALKHNSDSPTMEESKNSSNASEKLESVSSQSPKTPVPNKAVINKIKSCLGVFYINYPGLLEVCNELNALWKEFGKNDRKKIYLKLLNLQEALQILSKEPKLNDYAQKSIEQVQKVLKSFPFNEEKIELKAEPYEVYLAKKSLSAHLENQQSQEISSHPQFNMLH